MSSQPIDDGLKLPEIGTWGKRKYHFLERYLTIFTRAMKGKWKEIHFIDLFAGAGLARIRGTNLIVRTSTLIAAQLEVPFHGVHACDQSEENIHALRQRIDSLQLKNVTITCGDANKAVDSIVRRIPPTDTLCVTFADPFGLHLDFDTVRKIAKLRSDLIILLADNMDALRNWAAYYFDNPDSNLDKFMGDSDWRKSLPNMPKTDKQALYLRDRYKTQLSTLGYSHFGECRIQNENEQPIYSLIYASRNGLGVKFWNAALEVDETGQKYLQF